MKQTTTRLAPQRRPGLQTLKSALQRLTMTLSKGMPIESVSRVLGHTNIVTTQIYAKNTSQKLNADLTMLGDKLNASFKSIK